MLRPAFRPFQFEPFESGCARRIEIVDVVTFGRMLQWRLTVFLVNGAQQKRRHITSLAALIAIASISVAAIKPYGDAKSK
jgi:hypothetical protein